MTDAGGREYVAMVLHLDQIRHAVMFVLWFWLSFILRAPNCAANRSSESHSAPFATSSSSHAFKDIKEEANPWLATCQSFHERLSAPPTFGTVQLKPPWRHRGKVPRKLGK
ncbi:hypothetical protein HDV63DRAFT_406936 [Trichoderma sp. SZMC 28014]